MELDRPCDHSRDRDPLVVHRNSLGKVSFCQVLIEGKHRERINKSREKTLNKNPSTQTVNITGEIIITHPLKP